MLIVSPVLFFPDGACMILTFKYHGDSGRLVAADPYTLAQDNHLSDTICITSTADDCRDYDYCLDFVCYNSKNIPKMQYMSPVLQYGESGIRFDVPNQLTQFCGHVDMQLIGYRKADKQVLFKSTSHNSKAFDVQGSLGVLDHHLSDTPNVLTELKQELDWIRDNKSKLLLDFIDELDDDFSVVLGQYHYHRVDLYHNDDLVGTRYVVHGAKLPRQEFPLPSGARFDGDWYLDGAETPWDFDNDTVQSDLSLYANLYTDGVAVEDGIVTALPTDQRVVYVPRMHAGKRVTAIRLDSPTVFAQRTDLYLPETLREQSGLERVSRVGAFHIPPCNEYFCVRLWSLYTQEAFRLIRMADEIQLYSVQIDPACVEIGPYACAGLRIVNHIVLPASVAKIEDYAFADNGELLTLTLPPNVTTLGAHIADNCPQLKQIYCQMLLPVSASEETFASETPVFVPVEGAQAYRDDPVWSKFGVRTLGQDFAQQIAIAPYYDVLYDKFSDDPAVNLGFPNGLFQGESIDFPYIDEYDAFAIHVMLHTMHAPMVFWFSKERDWDYYNYGFGNRAVSRYDDQYYMESKEVWMFMQIIQKRLTIHSFHYVAIDDKTVLDPDNKIGDNLRPSCQVVRIWGMKKCRK